MITFATLTLSALVPQVSAPGGNAGLPSQFFWGDFSRDGLEDALVLSAGEMRLIRNQGDGRFEDVSQAMGLPTATRASSAAWADWNGDGSLDLFLCSEDGASALLELGPGNLFQDVTREVGLPPLSASQVRWLDFDSDGRFDLWLTTASGDKLYHNLGHTLAEVDLGLPPIGFQPGGALVNDLGHAKVTDTPEETAGEAGTSTPGDRTPLTPGGNAGSSSNNWISGGSSSGEAGTAPISQACTTSLEDQAGGGCISASSTPTLGMLYPLGSDFYVEAGTGRVGIGTTSPSSTLDVAGQIRSTGASGGRLLAYNPNNQNASVSLGWLDNVSRIRIGGSGSGASGGFEIQRVGDQPIFRLDDNGDLGLGTSAPAEKLEVVGDLRVRSNSDTNSAITSGVLQVRNTAGSQAVLIDSNEIASFGGTLNLNAPDINQPVAIDGDTLYVDPIGRVGVGTTSPDALLDVAGNIELDNQLAGGHATFNGQVFGGTAVGTVITVTQPGTGSQGTGIHVTNSTGGGDGVRVIMNGNTNGSAAGLSALVSSGNGRAVEGIATTGLAGFFQSQSGTVMDINRSDNAGTLFQARNGSDIEFRVDSDGNVYCDDSFINTGADYAEWLERADYSEEIGPADVVGVRGGKISMDLEGAEQILVVSTAPALVGNALGAESSERDGFEQIAFIGQAPVKMRGPVRSGDFVLPSGRNDGTARALAPSELKAEDLPQVLGRAWESSEAEGLHLVNVVIGVDQAAAAAVVIDNLQGEVKRLAYLDQRLVHLETTVANLAASTID